MQDFAGLKRFGIVLLAGVCQKLAIVQKEFNKGLGMKTPLGTLAGRSALLLFLVSGISLPAEATLETAGELLLSLDASALSEGPLSTLSAGRVFSQAEPANCPTVQTLQDGVKAVVFDGDDWMLSLPAGAGGIVLTNHAFTVEGWLLNPWADGQESLFVWDVGNGGSDPGDAWVFNTNGLVSVNGPDPGLACHQKILPVSNCWHHVAITCTGGSPSFRESGAAFVYVDGALNAWYPIPQLDNSWFAWQQDGTNVLGARLTSAGAPTAFFSGALARLRFHSGALTPAQVRANYEAERASFPAPSVGVPAAPLTAGGLVIDLDAASLPEGTLSSWSGIRTLSQGTSGSQPSVQTVAGVKAVCFDGNDWLSASDVDPRITGTSCVFTTEAWILNPTLELDEPYFSWAPRGGPNLTYAAVCYASSSSFGAASHWGTLGDMGFDGGVPFANTWHHLAVTYNAAEGTERIYVDGRLNATKTRALALHTNGVYQIGRASTLAGADTRYYSGALARLRVHAGVLTAEQVRENYRYFRDLYGMADPLTLASGAYFGGSATYADWGSWPVDAVAQVGECGVMNLEGASYVARAGLTGAARLSLAGGASLTVSSPVLVGGGDRSPNAPTSSLSVAGSMTVNDTSRYGVIVGLNGCGRVDIAPGGTLSLPNGGEFWVGHGNDGCGLVTVGAGARLTTTSWLLIGRAFGAGALAVDGGTVRCGVASLGEFAPASLLSLRNGATLNADTMYVGRRLSGGGTVLADHSTLKVSNSLVSGAEGADRNLIVVTNGATLVKNGTSCSLTQYGTGDFVACDCSTVDVRDAGSVVTFAANTGSVARVRVEKNSAFQLSAANSILQIGQLGDARVDVTGGSRLQANGIEMPGASGTSGSALLRLTDSELSIGAGGVRAASPGVPAGVFLSNSTLRAYANTFLAVPAAFSGDASVDTAGYVMSLDAACGGSLTKTGPGVLQIAPRSALTGEVRVVQGTLNVAPAPYVWRADDLSSMTNGQIVTSWRERNHGVSASAVAAGTGPLMVTNAVNGKRAVRFNPSKSTLLQIASGDSPLAGAESATIAVVFKPYAYGYASGLNAWWSSSLFIGGEVSGTANDWGFVFSQDGRIGLGLSQMSSAGNQDVVQFHSQAAALSQPHVAVCAWRPGAVALNLDGDETMNATVYTTGNGLPKRLEDVVLPRVTSPVYLGTGTAAQNRALDGEIAEIRVFRNHWMDACARQLLIRELGEAYGVSAAAAAVLPVRPSYAGQLSQQTFAVTSVPPAAAVWSADSLALADGAAVSAWPASTGSKNATPASGYQTNPPPVFAASGIGGRPAVRFFGCPLEVGAADNPSVGSGAFSAALVFRADAPGANAANWWSGSGLLGWKDSLTNNASDWGMALAGERIVAGAGACASSSAESGGAYRGNYTFNYTRCAFLRSPFHLADSGAHVVIYRWSNNGLHVVSVDGQSTPVDNLGTYRMSGMPLLIGGTRREETGFQGFISEVRIYTNALTEAQESVVGDELARRYGVALNAFGQPERLPGARITLEGAELSVSSNSFREALATIQPGQTLVAKGASRVNGVLCVAGQAALVLSSATDSLTVGDLALQNGAALRWRYEGKSANPVRVTGDLGLPSRFTLDLTGSGGIPPRLMTIIEYGGDVTTPPEGVAVDVIGAYKSGTKAVVVPDEKRLVLMTPAGTLLRLQ